MTYAFRTLLDVLNCERWKQKTFLPRYRCEIIVELYKRNCIIIGSTCKFLSCFFLSQHIWWMPDRLTSILSLILSLIEKVENKRKRLDCYINCHPLSSFLPDGKMKKVEFEYSLSNSKLQVSGIRDVYICFQRIMNQTKLHMWREKLKTNIWVPSSSSTKI